MRQSGILAAAGLYALEHHLPRLAQDHAHARTFAERLGECRAVRVTPPETNIVMIDLTRETDTADSVLPQLAQAGVLLVPFSDRRLRAVTHRDVSGADVARAADIVRAVLA